MLPSFDDNPVTRFNTDMLKEKLCQRRNQRNTSLAGPFFINRKSTGKTSAQVQICRRQIARGR